MPILPCIESAPALSELRLWQPDALMGLDKPDLGVRLAAIRFQSRPFLQEDWDEPPAAPMHRAERGSLQLLGRVCLEALEFFNSLRRP